MLIIFYIYGWEEGREAQTEGAEFYLISYSDLCQFLSKPTYKLAITITLAQLCMQTLLPLSFTGILLLFLSFYPIVLRLNCRFCGFFFFFLIYYCISLTATSRLGPFYFPNFAIYFFLSFYFWLFIFLIRSLYFLTTCVFYAHKQNQALLSCFWSAQFFSLSAVFLKQLFPWCSGRGLRVTFWKN